MTTTLPFPSEPPKTLAELMALFDSLPIEVRRKNRGCPAPSQTDAILALLRKRIDEEGPFCSVLTSPRVPLRDDMAVRDVLVGCRRERVKIDLRVRDRIFAIKPGGTISASLSTAILDGGPALLFRFLSHERCDCPRSYPTIQPTDPRSRVRCSKCHRPLAKK
jgi:hypothetical protein